MLSFLVKLCFSGTIRARVMKQGASIHLVARAVCTQNNKVMTFISDFTDLNFFCQIFSLSAVFQEL